jgi:hypothetical protein
MKKLLFILLLLPFTVFGQTTYQLNYDSIRVNKTAGTGGTSLYGKVYLKNVSAGLSSDSSLVVRNGRIFKYPAIPTLSFGTFGSTPNAQGGSYSAGVITLQPASATHPGGVTTGAQEFSGIKTFNSASGYAGYFNKTISTGGILGLQIAGVDKSFIEWNVNDGGSGVGTAMNLRNNQGAIGLYDSTNGGLKISGGNAVFGGTVTLADEAYSSSWNGKLESPTKNAIWDAGFLTSSNGVTSITGTANQITASSSTGAVTLSLPSAVIMPGRLTAGSSTFTTGGGHIYTSAANGVIHVAKNSSSTDWILVTEGGGNILEVPSGTTNTKFAALAGTGTRMVVADNVGTLSTQAIPSGGGGGSVNTVGVSSSNGFAGTSSGGTDPILTLSTTINSPVLAGNGTAISAATTTGSGSTVVLSTSPTLTTPNLGTPSTLVGTNITGTASGLTAGAITGQANSATITAASTETVSTIALRDGNGDIYARTFNMNPAYGDNAPNKLVGTSAGGQIREMSQAQAKSYLDLSGTNTGDQTTITGNAGTATALQTGRTISGTLFDGTANITLNNTGITNGAGYITSSALSPYAPLASPALTGTPTAPTQSALDNSTKIATTAYVDNAGTFKANLNSPALTGTPTAPTAAAGTNNTQIATTAYVDKFNLASGTYTPTLTNELNVSGASNDGNAQYTRVGNIVTVYGSVSFTQSSTGNSLIGISLPIASNFSAVTQAHGMGISFKTVSTNGVVSSDVTNDRATLSFVANSADTQTFRYSFSYSVL